MADATSTKATRKVNCCEVTTATHSTAQSTIIHVSLNMSVPFIDDYIGLLPFHPDSQTEKEITEVAAPLRDAASIWQS